MNNSCNNPCNNLCKNLSNETRGSNWSQFLRLVNYIACLTDSTNESSKCRSTPTAVPQLGDLIFSVAQLLVVPNFLDGDSSSCRPSDSARPGGSNLDNTIVRDLFVMTTRQFVDCYLDELVRNCDLTERSRVFQVKTWLSCRVHFDHQLIGSMTHHIVGQVGSNIETLRKVEKTIGNATNGRLVFRDDADKATLSRIESFSPTFALFTLCNIREEYMATAFTQQNRFSATTETSLSSVGKPPTVDTCLVLYGENNGRPDHYRERKSEATKRLFEGGSVTQVQKAWPEQRLLANARGLVNRDKTLQRFVSVACAESTERGDRPTDDTPDAIKLFDRHDYFESRYQADRASTTLALVRGFDTYRALLNNLCLAWGKLNYLEPRIFT